MALPARAGDGQGVLQGALQSRDAVGEAEWFTNSLNYYLSCQFFNAFPLPQREAGTRQTLRYIGEVLADGYSVLIFPEGKRTMTGEIGTLQAGRRHDWRASRTCRSCRSGSRASTRCCHTKMKVSRARPGACRFGAPLRLAGEDYPALAKQVEDAVSGFERLTPRVSPGTLEGRRPRRACPQRLSAIRGACGRAAMARAPSRANAPSAFVARAPARQGLRRLLLCLSS